MGTYYIKQKIFSFRDRYFVYDQNEQPVYEVTGKFFSLGAQLTISDLHGRELYLVKRKLLSLFGAYEVYQGDVLCASIQRRATFFKPKLEVDSDYGHFDIQGDVFNYDFSITKDGREVGNIQKKWFKLSDTYELSIANDENAPFFIAIVIAIDNCLHNSNGGHNS